MTDPRILTDEQLEAAIARVAMRNSCLDFRWKFRWERVSHYTACNGWFLRVEFERPDTGTGAVGIGVSRKEFVPHEVSLSGLVKTCWLLLELTIRHELMESFRFDGRRIFNPHNSVLDLVRLQDGV